MSLAGCGGVVVDGSLQRCANGSDGVAVADGALFVCGALSLRRIVDDHHRKSEPR